MKVMILNGTASPRPDIDNQVRSLAQALGDRGHGVTEVLLRNEDIRDCVGCFACWVKTPGRCVHRDGMEGLLRQVVDADRLVYVSDVHLHHLSPVLKGFLDRLLPLRRAYLTVGSDGKLTHYPRYRTHYRTMLLVEDHPDLDDGDLVALAASCGRRQPDFCGAYRLNQPVQEVLHALDRP